MRERERLSVLGTDRRSVIHTSAGRWTATRSRLNSFDIAQPSSAIGRSLGPMSQTTGLYRLIRVGTRRGQPANIESAARPTILVATSLVVRLIRRCCFGCYFRCCCCYGCCPTDPDRLTDRPTEPPTPRRGRRRRRRRILAPKGADRAYRAVDDDRAQCVVTSPAMRISGRDPACVRCDREIA